MLRKTHIAVLFLAVAISIQGHSQDLSSIPASNTINLRFLNSNDGMSQNYIFAVCQDLQGFIWMGTINGLNKFDGQDFQNFYNIQSDSLSISNNNIRHMFTDREGELCISTANGFDIYDSPSGRFIRYCDKSGKSKSWPITHVIPRQRITRVISG